MARITRTKTRHILLGAVDMEEASPPPASVARQEEETPNLEKLKTRAREAAREHGHQLGYFTTASSIAVMARCDRCGRCAVVAPSRWVTDGIGFGGRATREACTTTSTLTGLGRTKEERMEAKKAARAAKAAARATRADARAAATAAKGTVKTTTPIVVEEGVLRQIERTIIAAAAGHRLLDYDELREHFTLSPPVFREAMTQLATTRNKGHAEHGFHPVEPLFVVVHKAKHLTDPGHWLFRIVDAGKTREERGPRIKRWHATLRHLGFAEGVDALNGKQLPWPWGKLLGHPKTFARPPVAAPPSSHGNGAADQAEAQPKPAAKAKAKAKAKAAKPAAKKTAPAATSASA